MKGEIRRRTVASFRDTHTSGTTGSEEDGEEGRKAGTLVQLVRESQSRRGEKRREGAARSESRRRRGRWEADKESRQGRQGKQEARRREERRRGEQEPGSRSSSLSLSLVSPAAAAVRLPTRSATKSGAGQVLLQRSGIAIAQGIQKAFPLRTRQAFRWQQI